MFDLATFSVSDMVVCSSELRQITQGAATMECAAREIVRYLRHNFRDPRTGRPALLLVRLFQTVPAGRLTPPLREHAASRLAEPPDEDVRCLTLLATEGDRPEWCDRTRSRSHQVIPLPDADSVKRQPLLAALLDQLGIDPQVVVDGDLLHKAADWEGFETYYLPDAEGSRELPDQDFVRQYGVRSVLGFGGSLPSGDMFTLLMFSRVPVPPATADLFRTVAVSARLALLPFHHAPLFAGQSTFFTEVDDIEAAQIDALEQLLAVQEDTSVEQARVAQHALGRVRTQTQQLQRSAQELRAKQKRLEHEARIVETLYSVGQSLAQELNLDRLVQMATDAGTSVVGAEFGAFFYTVTEADGESRIRFALSGADRADFEKFPMPRNTELFGPTFPGTDVVRIADVLEDPRYGRRSPYRGMPPGHLPVRSFLAMPVTSRSGEILGSFYFGHHKTGVFTERDEQLAKGIAAQAASAIDNARLYRRVRDTAVELQRSLLPASPPVIDELEVAFRYVPGARGSAVGGDWFDVIPLAAGRVALVIGDVMGRGIKAAAVMGQLRTAVRAYAVMDLPPAQIMYYLNRLVTGLATEQIVTCVYAVYDPGTMSICWSNAGHMPPALITAAHEVHLLDPDLGVPLGVDGAMFSEEQRTFAAGTRLLLYTDGLVECHDRSLSDRLRQLTGELTHLSGDTQTTCDKLLASMLTGEEHDDVALLLVRARTTIELQATLELPPSVRAAREARSFVRTTLEAWELADRIDSVCSVVSELVTNAFEHAHTPLELRLRRHPHKTVIEVADRDGRMPQMVPTVVLDERHRGLLIVSCLASRWGVRPTDSGKVVWAEITDQLAPVPMA